MLIFINNYFWKFQVSFNPITSNSIKKVLSRICKEERCNVSAEQVDLIANASGGDIRNAITSLQFFFLKPTPMHSLPSSITPPRHAKGKQDPLYAEGKPNMVNALDNGCSLQFGRDDTLSLFHALGKFLHNKRETENMELGMLIKVICSFESFSFFQCMHGGGVQLRLRCHI